MLRLRRRGFCVLQSGADQIDSGTLDQFPEFRKFREKHEIFPYDRIAEDPLYAIKAIQDCYNMLPSMGDWAKWIDHAVRVAKSAGYKQGRRDGLEEAAKIAERRKPKTEVDLFNEAPLMRRSIADAIRARLKVPPRR